MIHPDLKTLVDAYPIAGWPQPEVYFEQVKIESFQLDLVGLSLGRNDSPQITASAAGFDSNIYTRAYFELIERCALFQAEKDMTFFYLEKENRSTGVEISRDKIFPTSPQSGDWRYAKSNGVAAHLSWEQACHAATLEMKERHALLRSWYANRPPRLLRTPSELSLSPLTRMYDIRSYEFESDLPVVGVFGFPLKKNLPVFFGFGAHESLETATQHAIQEAYQRLGFTWDEALPELEPEAEPTPLFHLNYYLCAEKERIIHQWLEGNLPNRSVPRMKSCVSKEIGFIDLTPEAFKGTCAVVKAVCDDYMPLTFGKWHPWIGPDLGMDLFPHPIS